MTASVARAIAGAVSIALLLVLSPAPAVAQQKAPSATAEPRQLFATPQAAADAFIAAVRALDRAALRAMLGASYRQLVPTDDAAADKRRGDFLKAHAAGSKLVMRGEAKAVLEVGTAGWTLPVPIAKVSGGWSFDADAGVAEIAKRAIGRNELSVIQVMLALVDAQKEYALLDPMKTGLRPYARLLMSTPGKKDGLHWRERANDPQSPLGDLVAKAQEGGANVKDDGYFGYRFRILTRQGANAPGGVQDYLAKGLMIGGFAAIASPARYGGTGIMSFIVSHDGVVYEKDLGPDSAAIAARIQAFDPDKSWSKSDPAP